MTDKFSNVLKAKEDLQKSPEQLEAEKREILASRIPRLSLDGKLKGDLIQIAQQFHETLINLHNQVYDLIEKQERQKYNMMELSERARQIEKGKAKNRKSNIVHTGLGGGIYATELFPQAPQKISLFSRYERVTDHRTFKDRRELWSSEKKAAAFEPVKVKAKIKHIEEPKEEVKVQRRKPKSESPAPAPAEEEHHEEEAAPAEEEHHEEEAAPAEEEHHEEEEAAPAEEEHHEEEAADEE